METVPSFAPARRSRTPARTGRRARAVAAGAALVLVVLAAGIHFSEERASVDRLSDAERVGLYQRTVENLRTVCSPPGRHPELAGFCEDQARLALRFPECDDACRTLARPLVSGATR